MFNPTVLLTTEVIPRSLYEEFIAGLERLGLQNALEILRKNMHEIYQSHILKKAQEAPAAVQDKIAELAGPHVEVKELADWRVVVPKMLDVLEGEAGLKIYQ